MSKTPWHSLGFLYPIFITMYVNISELCVSQNIILKRLVPLFGSEYFILSRFALFRNTVSLSGIYIRSHKYCGFDGGQNENSISYCSFILNIDHPHCIEETKIFLSPPLPRYRLTPYSFFTKRLSVHVLFLRFDTHFRVLFYLYKKIPLFLFTPHLMGIINLYIDRICSVAWISKL